MILFFGEIMLWDFLVKLKVYYVKWQQTFAKLHFLNLPIFFLEKISSLKMYKKGLGKR